MVWKSVIPNSAVHEASPPYTKGRQSLFPIPFCLGDWAGPLIGGTPNLGSVISAALEKQGKTVVCEIWCYHSGDDKDSSLLDVLDLADGGKFLWKASNYWPIDMVSHFRRLESSKEY